jgi:hypothetical protein
MVGLARQEDDDTPAPMAAVETKPSVQYAFTPQPAVYIIAIKVDEGRIIDFPASTANFIKVEFRGNQWKAIMSEQTTGKFIV